VVESVGVAGGYKTNALRVESFKTEGSIASSVTGIGVSVGHAVNKDTSVNVNYARASKLNSSSFGVNATIGAAGIGDINDRNSLLNTKVNTVYAASPSPSPSANNHLWLMGVRPTFSKVKKQGGQCCRL
jgi:hypothetical protein